jgi:hypothetical protein
MMKAETFCSVKKLNKSLIENGLPPFSEWHLLGAIQTTVYGRNFDSITVPVGIRGVYIIWIMMNGVLRPIYCGKTLQRGGIRQRVAQHVQICHNEAAGHCSGILKAPFQLSDTDFIYFASYFECDDPAPLEFDILRKYDFICNQVDNGDYRFDDLLLLRKLTKSDDWLKFTLKKIVSQNPRFRERLMALR